MITLVSGENEYAIKQHVDEVVQTFTDKNGPEGVDKRRGEDIKTADIPDLLGGISLFSAERIVIIDQPQQSQELSEYLAERIETVPADTKLVLVEPKPDKRMKWYKQVKKHGRVIEKTNLRGHELAAWVAKTVKERAGQIDRVAAGYLVERAGANQWHLHNEIDKLLSYDRTITLKSIDELVEPGLDETIFQLLDRALQGDEVGALNIYDELIKRDLDAYQAVTMLGWQVHNMVLVKTNLNSSPGTLASQAGLAPFVVTKTSKIVRKLNLAQIRQLVGLILAAERDLKTSGMDAHRRTRHLIIQVAQVTK